MNKYLNIKIGVIMKKFFSNMGLITLVLIISAAISLANQDEESIKKDLPLLLGSTNQGTEFFMTFHPAWESGGLEGSGIKIYVASAEETPVTLEIPGLDFSQTKIAKPGYVLEFTLDINKAVMYRKTDRDKPQPHQIYEGRACIITSETPVVCYGVARFRATSDGYLAIPTTGLGKKYVVSSWNDPTLDDGGDNNVWQYLTSYTSIIAVFDDTDVDFTLGGEKTNYTSGPKVPRFEILQTGDMDKHKMNKGDVWLIGVNGDYNDLSGSFIQADKPVAVISGSFCAYIPLQTAACDYIIEQDMPMSSWGTKYHVTQIVDREKTSFVKIYASKPDTRIYRDGEEWNLVKDVGGEANAGYIRRRAVDEQDGSRPAVISGSNRISVTQYNTGQYDDDESIESDPFQMVLTPIEQYQTEIVFCTPGVNGGASFKRNYINLCYKATTEGKIPDHIEIGQSINGVYAWTPLNVAIVGTGTVFQDPDVTDGRPWKSITVGLEDPSAIYAVRGDEVFSAYGYGFDYFDSYGWPVSVALTDLSVPDVWAPSVTWTIDCYGHVEGRAYEEPRNIDSLRSNFSSVTLILSESHNYILDWDEDGFVIGETKRIDFELDLEDQNADGKATLVFVDRSGNDTTIIIEHERTNFRISPKVSSWGQLNYNDPSVTKELTLKNTSDKEVEVDSIMVLSKDGERTYAENGFSLDPEIYTSGTLPGLMMQPDEELVFKVIFDPAVVEDEIKAGKEKFVDSIGVKAYWSNDVKDYCYYQYQAAVQSTSGSPVITVDRIDFGTQTVGSTSGTKKEDISNVGNAPLTITGATGPDGLAAKIYEVTKLGSGFNELQPFAEISPENPIVIEEGKSVSISMQFTPDAVQQYPDQIEFISDSDEGNAAHDPILELTGEGKIPGINIEGYNWGKQRTHLTEYNKPGNPYGNSSFPYEKDESNKTVKLVLSNDEERSLTIDEATVFLAESTNPDYFEININGTTSPLKDGLASLIGETLPGNGGTLSYPVTYDPLLVGNHIAKVVIVGSDAGFEVSDTCYFEGNSWYPQGVKEDYFFTEFAVDSIIDAGYSDTYYPPVGTAIVHDSETPYFEFDIDYTALAWDDFADTLRIYDIEFDNQIISTDINTPGNKFFAIDENALDVALGNNGALIAPGETFTFKARYYPNQNSGPLADGLEDAIASINYRTDTDVDSYISDWRGRSITQGASTTGDAVETCILYDEYMQISITNTELHTLQIDSITWNDIWAQNLNNNIDRFYIDPADMLFTLAPNETQTINVLFNQAIADQNNDGVEQVFTFHTNILASNTDVTLPITSTLTTVVISYPRMTYATIGSDKTSIGNPAQISFKDGGDQINYRVYLDDIAGGNMDNLDEVMDFDVTIIYDNNYLGPETSGSGDNFKINTIIGNTLNSSDYEIISSVEEVLTPAKLLEYETTNPSLHQTVTQFSDEYKVSTEMLTQIVVKIKNKSEEPILESGAIELVTLNFLVSLNENNFNASQGEVSRETRILHSVTTNEACLIPEYESDPYLQLEEVCAENIRLIEINMDSNGELTMFKLEDVNPNVIGTNGADINYELAFDCNTVINIYDATGKVVATPVNKHDTFGKHTIALPINKLPSGTYFINMQAGPYSETKRIVVAK